MRNKNLTAITLRAVNYGDSDKILTLFSLEEGIVSARAKGVKKARAKLKFAAEPFCFGNFEVAFGSSLGYVLTGCESKNLFYSLREDILKYYLACSFMEYCSEILQAGETSEALFNQLLKGLSLLETELPPHVVAIYFFYNALSITGFDIDLTTINMSYAKVISKFITVELSELSNLEIPQDTGRQVLKLILEHINRDIGRKNKSLAEAINLL